MNPSPAHFVAIAVMPVIESVETLTADTGGDTGGHRGIRARQITLLSVTGPMTA